MKSQTDHIALEGVKAKSGVTSLAAGGQEATEALGWKQREISEELKWFSREDGVQEAEGGRDCSK